MDTPQGTFYRVYFDIFLTLDGSEFNAELVCQGEVMGRCVAKFRQSSQYGVFFSFLWFADTSELVSCAKQLPTGNISLSKVWCLFYFTHLFCEFQRFKKIFERRDWENAGMSRGKAQYIYFAPRTIFLHFFPSSSYPFLFSLSCPVLPCLISPYFAPSLPSSYISIFFLSHASS